MRAALEEREERGEWERGEAAGAKKRAMRPALEERTAVLLEEGQRLGLLLYVEEARGVGLQQPEAALLVRLLLVRDAPPRLRRHHEQEQKT